ncbi:TPA: hypothetical protein DCG61_00120 [Patescibacteria group bacterium]|jgi:micrococcal nuclease|nr:hypothetical protein [Patescibacteria group bacterium]
MNKLMETHKPKLKILALVCLVQLGSFGAGLYSGHTYWPKQSVQVALPNYTTENVKAPKPTAPTNTTQPTPNTECNIKGSKSRLYHLPGGAFYDRTNPQVCFETEAEAQAAGYTKSSR